MATAVGTSQSCLFWGCQKYDNNIELCSVANIACVKWKATNIALGQYWFLLLLHGFIPSGPGQYGVLLPWLEEDMTKYIMSVLYPPIQEEMGIRRNIARGPKGRGQYFPVFSSPLGLGGTIRTLCTRSCPPQARAIKLRIALVLVEWSHAGGGETNIDLGQYWSLAARLPCIPLQGTHQELYSVSKVAGK